MNLFSEDGKMIITISGTSGSGKSTIAKELAKALGYRHYSMGDLQRRFAMERGMTIVELGELEKQDPSLDKKIDALQKKIGETENGVVIDSWLGAHFIPQAVKIFIDADIDERARRISQKREAEKYKNAATAKRNIIQKEDTNRKRWKQWYGYDFRDPRNYDLLIDDTALPAKDVVKKIIEYLANTYKGSGEKRRRAGVANGRDGQAA